MNTHLEHMEAKAQEIGQLIGGAIKKSMPDVGFCLTLQHFGDGGFLTYVSNCEREDCIKLLQECIVTLVSKKEKPVYPFSDERKDAR